MKILIVNKFLYPNGGSETYIFKLGEQLNRLGHEVQYFGMEHEGRIVGNHAEQYTSNMDFHSGKLAKLLYPFKIIYSKEAYKKLTLVLKDFNPDVVHLNNFNFQLTPSVIYAVKDYEKKSGKRIKLVYTAHDGQLVCPNHLMQQYISHERCEQCISGSCFNCAKNKCIHGSLVKSLLGSIEAFIYRTRKTYGLIDLVICPSNFLKTKLDVLSEIRYKTVVLHNFVDQIDFKGQVEKEDYILYLGRYSEEKGVRTLLKVCKALLEEYPEIRFKFAGNGPLEDEVNSLENIENVGFVAGEDKYDLIRKAKLTIFPSECNENCPFTVMESLMCGTPVLAADVGGVPELVVNEINGELFIPGDVNGLTDRIVNLYIDNVLKMNAYSEESRKVTFDSLDEYTNKLIRIIDRC